MWGIMPVAMGDYKMATKMTSIGRNVVAFMDGDTIVIRMDASAKGTESKSGKSSVVASTNGNVGVPGTDLKIGLNLYRSI